MTSFDVIIFMGILGVMAILTTGLVSMARGGVYDFEHETEFMVLRVGVQLAIFIAILIGTFHTA